MDGDLVQDRIAAPDEHAAVPVVSAGFDESIGEGFIRFFVESLHMEGPRDAQRVAAMNVAQAGVAIGGDDSEGDQRLGAIGDNLEGGSEALLESRNRFDDVIGGNDRSHGIGIAFFQHGRGKTNGVGGVAADRLAQEIFFGHFLEVAEYGGGMGLPGADENTLRRQQAAKAFVAELQESFSVDDGEELLGHIGA
jgi:hypothetical protein